MADERCGLICIDAPRVEPISDSLIVEESAREAANRARALSDPTRLMLTTALRAAKTSGRPSRACAPATWS
jgi:hypothetical protein